MLKTLSLLLCVFTLAVCAETNTTSQPWPENLTVQYQHTLIDITYHSMLDSRPVYRHPKLNNFALAVDNKLLIRHDPNLALASLPALKALQLVELFNVGEQCWSLVITKGAKQTLSLLKELKNYSAITSVEPDFLQFRLTPDSNQDTQVWQNQKPKPVRQILQLDNWPENAGEGITVAIIDKAFRLQDPALRDIAYKLHFSIDELSVRTLRPSLLKTQVRDGFHGDSAVATIWSKHPDLRGIAPYANAVLLTREYNWTSDILLAMRLADTANADIILCPWTLSFTQQALSDVLDNLVKEGRGGKGTIIVVSAGNNIIQLDNHFMLANQPQVFTVNGHSNGRDWPAQGQNILTAVHVPYLVYHDQTEEYNLPFTGTSAAASAFAGITAAILSQYPEMTNRQFRALVEQHAVPLANGQRLMNYLKAKAITEQQNNRRPNGSEPVRNRI